MFFLSKTLVYNLILAFQRPQLPLCLQLTLCLKSFQSHRSFGCAKVKRAGKQKESNGALQNPLHFYLLFSLIMKNLDYSHFSLIKTRLE